ncbi:hypothetical protein EP7_004906 [Isosphaeraceae bacterium EP7]
MEDMGAESTEHDFDICLAEGVAFTDELTDSLFEAGCDDATVSQRHGRLTLSFCREAPSFKDAVLSAIADVAKAGLGPKIVRVDLEGLMSQSDIARKIGRSRQLVHQYVSGATGPGGFPPPVGGISGPAPAWNWQDVAEWLLRSGLSDDRFAQEANGVAAINAALEMKRQLVTQPELAAEAMALIGLHHT